LLAEVHAVWCDILRSKVTGLRTVLHRDCPRCKRFVRMLLPGLHEATAGDCWWLLRRARLLRCLLSQRISVGYHLHTRCRLPLRWIGRLVVGSGYPICQNSENWEMSDVTTYLALGLGHSVVDRDNCSYSFCLCREEFRERVESEYMASACQAAITGFGDDGVIKI
jgi:hypothetical protein